MITLKQYFELDDTNPNDLFCVLCERKFDADTFIPDKAKSNPSKRIYCQHEGVIFGQGYVFVNDLMARLNPKIAENIIHKHYPILSFIDDINVVIRPSDIYINEAIRIHLDCKNSDKTFWDLNYDYIKALMTFS